MSLRLEWNRLQQLTNTTFTGLQSLTSLDLSHNRLQELSPGALAPLVRQWQKHPYLVTALQSCQQSAE